MFFLRNHANCVSFIRRRRVNDAHDLISTIKIMRERHCQWSSQFLDRWMWSLLSILIDELFVFSSFKLFSLISILICLFNIFIINYVFNCITHSQNLLFVLLFRKKKIFLLILHFKSSSIFYYHCISFLILRFLHKYFEINLQTCNALFNCITLCF